MIDLSTSTEWSPKHVNGSQNQLILYSGAGKDLPMRWWKVSSIKQWLQIGRLYDKVFAYCTGGLNEARRVAHEIVTFRQPRRSAKRTFLRVESLEPRLA